MLPLGFKIGGIQKSSFIDYPEKISAIIFTQGCNFRCPYCHNPELISSEALPSLESFSVLEFLKSRIGKLDAVVITGGEPCLQPDLADFIKEVKALGFLVKLDTNGSNPELLEKLLKEGLVDYVAMDIKAPIEKYSDVVCCEVDSLAIKKSIEIIKSYSVGYEFRTTVVESQLDFEDFKKIGRLLKGAKKYYLQKFVPTKTLNKKFLDQSTYSDEEYEKLCSVLNKYVEEVYVR